MKNKYLAKIALAGMLNLVGGFYTSNSPQGVNNQTELNKKIEYLRSEEYRLKKENEARIDSIMNYPKISKSEVDKLIKEKHRKVRPKYTDVELIKAIIKQESGYNQFATSHRGAKGLMQIMNDNYIKPTGKELSDTIELYLPEINIETGINTVKKIERFCETQNPYWNELEENEKQRLILASYNGGIGKLRDKEWNISRMPRETRNYVDIVMNNYEKTKHK
jgi:soluble lytic murein transglycosylase-like protein